jgi:hypothetical protein
VEGWRPAMVFNSTLVETGERFTITSLDLPPTDPERRGVGRRFVDLYPNHDVSVATAARLSATFPWVTPVSRPLTQEDDLKMYHVADGGYYDNFGVVSAVQFLEQVLPHHSGDTVLLIEIRASDSTKVESPRLKAGFRMETIGPAETMLAVRTASQIARNDLDVQLLKRATGCIKKNATCATADIRSVVFELREKAPLSWHLSTRQKEIICSHWQEQRIQDGVVEVAKILGRTRRNPSEDMKCPAP